MSSPAVARRHRLLRCAAPAALLVVCALLLSGCEANPQSSLAPQSDVANKIQNLLLLTIYWGVAVVVPVEAVLLFAILRFRRRPGQAAGPPTGLHGSTRLEIAWTIVPVLILTAIAIPTVQTIFQTAQAAPASSVQIEVIGHQWWWEFRYPKLHIVTANELHLPVGVTANFSLTSADVIHSFWLPAFDGKRDVFPNHQNNLWFTPDKTGVYPGQCAEFCGPAHAYMEITTVVQSKAAFDAWARQQAQPAAAPASALASRGAAIFGQSACSGCHTIAGTAASGQVGPNLTHVGSRMAIGVQIPMDGKKVPFAGWIADSSHYKPGSNMPPQNLSSSDLAAVVAYLQGLK